jgi:hypothetical protein
LTTHIMAKGDGLDDADSEIVHRAVAGGAGADTGAR